MTRPAVMIVTDTSGQRGFIDATADGWDPALPHTRIRLPDGGVVVVPTASLVRQADGTLRCSRDLADVVRDGAPDEPARTIPVVAESLRLTRERRETGRVHIQKQVHTRDETVEVPLLHEQVEVERVAVGRPVDGPVAIRHEGDTMIIPVLEEVLVVEKRWILREELHVRTRRSTHNESRTVNLRSEQVTVERAPTAVSDASPDQAPSGPASTPGMKP